MTMTVDVEPVHEEKPPVAYGRDREPDDPQRNVVPPEPAPATGYEIPSPPLGYEETSKEPVEFFFLVYVTPDGKVIATSDDIVMRAAGFEASRKASINDMRRASHEVIEDVNMMMVTQNVVNAQISIARQASQQAQAQQLLDGAIDLSALKDRKRP